MEEDLLKQTAISNGLVALLFETHSGSAAKKYVPLVGKYRNEFFREFPYLYSAKDFKKEEKEYQKPYNEAPSLVVATAKDKQSGAVIGLIVGMALKDFHMEADNFDSPQSYARIETNRDRTFYVSEIFVEPAHQGQGIGDTLFKELEQKLTSTNQYDLSVFMSIDRPKDHPLRPKNYKGPESLWRRNHYEKTGILISYDWPTFQADGSVKVQKNAMDLWLKRLSR